MSKPTKQDAKRAKRVGRYLAGTRDMAGHLYPAWPITLKGKHDSDSDIYDENGNYVQKKFDALFERFDTDGDNGISEDEFAVLYSRNYESATGSIISRFEFGLLMDIAGETRTKTSTWSACSSWWCPSYTSTSTYKVLTRSDLSGFYDGSLLYELAGEQAPF